MSDLSWDERWAQKRAEATPKPDPWLRKQAIWLGGGTALDLACGLGRNSILLAQKGYHVFAVDSAPTALEILTATAQGKNLNITPLLHDLTQGLPANPPNVDLVLCFYYLQRSLFPAIKQKIRTGGLFIGRSFCQTEKHSLSSEIIYNQGELTEIFSDWEILAHEEGIESSNRGGTLSGIVARKP